ncbi:hypothetical protein RD792_015864 [Penstemon davidsonii]|uniref:Uncharacterized protein n=1 Tax=Penstemon davidsonii TaxID=160366 RepID=A0ABR0CHT0_9LAMI|nr:hypothetical protein RD792_015864 [Penstemon davidsonii]
MTSSPSILNLSFNNNNGCFSVATTNGFIIYTIDPFTHIFTRDFPNNGGIAVAQILLRTNILVLVGGGPSPQFPLNKVMIWDDNQSRSIGELSFRSNVKSVRLRCDCIIVVLLQKILVYNFSDLTLMHEIETAKNHKGLCEVSQSGEMVLVCMGLQKGQVRVENFARVRGLSKRTTRFVMAHDSSVECVALTKDGRLMASASSKGCWKIPALCGPNMSI